MTCCTYPHPHRHYPDWLREGPITEDCKCGQHPRRWTVDDLLTLWKSRPPRKDVLNVTDDTKTTTTTETPTPEPEPTPKPEPTTTTTTTEPADEDKDEDA